MSQFEELNNNVTCIKDLLLQNQNLLKLISVDTSNPLSSSDITQPNSLFFDRIFPQPKTIDIINEEKTLLTYIFSNAKLDELKFKESKLIFNIICHVNLWKIDSGIRPYLISKEIDSIFNEFRGTQSTNLSIGKVLFSDWVYREYNNRFCGYYLIYDLYNFN